MKIPPVLATLIFITTACGKNKDAATQASTPQGYHDVIYQSGLPVYRIISIPSPTEMVIYQYYLNADLSAGTFSVDRAKISGMTSSQMTLTYYNSDCKISGDSETLMYSYFDDYEFAFTLSSTGTKEYDAFTTQVPIKKVIQYSIGSYTYSPTCR